MSSYSRLPNSVVENYRKIPVLQDIMTVSSGYREKLTELGYLTRKKPDNEFFIKYCIYGRGWLRFKDREILVRKGDLVFCPNNMLHEYGADTNDPWSAFWVYYTGDLAKTYYNLLKNEFNDNIASIGYDRKIYDYFYEIAAIMRKGYSQNHIAYASNLFKAMVSYLLLASPDKRHEEESLEGIITFMEENLDKILTLSSFSTILNVSNDYFIRKFKKRYGYTPMDYFIGLKIQRATELLNHHGMTITMISEKLGYDDIYYFSKIFKKRTGLSPRAYRERFYR